MKKLVFGLLGALALGASALPSAAAPSIDAPAAAPAVFHADATDARVSTVQYRQEDGRRARRHRYHRRHHHQHRHFGHGR